MKQALEVLRARGVVAAPTETLYGLLVDATEAAAIDALLAVKPRGHDKGIPLVVPDLATWRRLVVEVPRDAARLAQAFWPGPLTIALPAAPGLDRRLTLEGTVAVRWPGASAALDLACALGRPLTATSANLPGEPPARTGAEARHALRAAAAEVALHVVEGVAAGGVPSTVVTFAEEKLRIVRVGAIDEATLLAAIDEPCGD